MNVKERVTEELKCAMKAQDKLRTSVLRMVLADIKIADGVFHILRGSS